jgi:hypothetical protein
MTGSSLSLANKSGEPATVQGGESLIAPFSNDFRPQNRERSIGGPSQLTSIGKNLVVHIELIPIINRAGTARSILWKPTLTQRQTVLQPWTMHLSTAREL